MTYRGDQKPPAEAKKGRLRRVPPDVIAEIEARAASGEYASDIARAVGLSHTATARHIRRWRDRKGLPAAKRGMRPALGSGLVARIAAGETYTAMASSLGITRSAVSKRVKTYRNRHGEDSLPGAFDQMRSRARRRRLAVEQRKAREARMLPSHQQAARSCSIYAAVAAQVPRHITGALRDDIISDAYLAYMERIA